MNTTCLRGKHLALRDALAPYRGTWTICADTDGCYWALHDTADTGSTMAVVEECSFRRRSDLSRFVRHLVLHGWSVVENSQPSATGGLLW